MSQNDNQSDQALQTSLISKDEVGAVLPPLPNVGASSIHVETEPLKNAVNWLAVCFTLTVGIWGMGVAIFELPLTRDSLAGLGVGENPLLIEARRNASALAADANQSLPSIVAAYEDVLRLDPSDQEAQDSISAATDAWIDTFESALTTNQLTFAQSRISELLSVDPTNGQYMSMFERLQDRRQALRLASDTSALLRVSATDADEPREMAVQAYREVLRLYPASTEAATELRELGTYFVEAAIRKAQAGEISQAIDYLQQADLADPSHERLPAARSEVQKATTLQETIKTRLAYADRSLLAGNLIQPVSENAAELYHSVLATDPNNELALLGLGRVSTAIVSELGLILENQQFGRARDIIERAKAVGLYPASIMLMETKLSDSLQLVADVQQLISSAEKQFERGWITSPDGSSAVDYLLEAYRLLPDNQTVLDLIDQCVERLTEVSNEARQAGLSDVASNYVELANRVIDSTQ